MRLHKGDIVRLADDDGVVRLKRVVRLSPSNGILYLVAHNEAGDFAKRHADNDDPFRWDFAGISRLKTRGCAKATLSELGRPT